MTFLSSDLRQLAIGTLYGASTSLMRPTRWAMAGSLAKPSAEVATPSPPAPLPHGGEGSKGYAADQVSQSLGSPRLPLKTNTQN